MVQTRTRKNLNKRVTTRSGPAVSGPKEPERLETEKGKSAAPIKVNKQMICKIRIGRRLMQIKLNASDANLPFRSSLLRRRSSRRLKKENRQMVA